MAHTEIQIGYAAGRGGRGVVWCAYELADGRRGGGERGDGVGEDAREHRREAGVVGEGQPREHPVQGVQPLRVRLLRGGGRGRGRGRRRRLLRHFPRWWVLESPPRRRSLLPAQEGGQGRLVESMLVGFEPNRS